MLCRRAVWPLAVIGVCFLAVVASPGVLGKDQLTTVPSNDTVLDAAEPSHEEPDQPLTNQELLNELTRIRDDVGRSILAGTVLETTAGESKAEFELGIKRILRMPHTTVATHQLVPDRSKGEIVKLLRDQCTQLDRIASEIEELKQYRNADQLRETAKQLRSVARQLDK